MHCEKPLAYFVVIETLQVNEVLVKTVNVRDARRRQDADIKMIFVNLPVRNT